MKLLQLDKLPTTAIKLQNFLYNLIKPLRARKTHTAASWPVITACKNIYVSITSLYTLNTMYMRARLYLNYTQFKIFYSSVFFLIWICNFTQEISEEYILILKRIKIFFQERKIRWSAFKLKSSFN